MAIHVWSGVTSRGYMLRKTISGLFHPYIYKYRENAEKQIGWFGDYIEEVRIVKCKPRKKKQGKK